MSRKKNSPTFTPVILLKALQALHGGLLAFTRGSLQVILGVFSCGPCVRYSSSWMPCRDLGVLILDGVTLDEDVHDELTEKGFDLCLEQLCHGCPNLILGERDK